MSESTNKMMLDELAEVAGGTYLESADDAKRFSTHGVKLYSGEIFGVPNLEWGLEELRKQFAKYGVEVRARNGVGGTNEYLVKGQRVSRE